MTKHRMQWAAGKVDFIVAALALLVTDCFVELPQM